VEPLDDAALEFVVRWRRGHRFGFRLRNQRATFGRRVDAPRRERADEDRERREHEQREITAGEEAGRELCDDCAEKQRDDGGDQNAFHGDFGATRFADSMTTASIGTSCMPPLNVVRTDAIASTTSMPPVTLPNTV